VYKAVFSFRPEDFGRLGPGKPALIFTEKEESVSRDQFDIEMISEKISKNCGWIKRNGRVGPLPGRSKEGERTTASDITYRVPGVILIFFLILLTNTSLLAGIS